MHVSLRFLALASVLFQASLASALPIGFGRSQGNLEYQEIHTSGFYLYHDKRAPHEARAILEALEAARPKLEHWLGVKRETPLKVVLSAATSNASFANFIVDAIELQTMGRGGRDLAWHEYSHSTMYRHLDNLFGPAGSIIHLPWMPAWWIEGLAEAMSVSNGSDIQYGIERSYALSGQWPTYDKLHSLYDGSRFSSIGYAISGALVSYIIRTYGPEKLPEMLNAFYRYSMPWWWPWSVVPFSGFMPMDEALREYTGKTGPQLYDEYKAAAEKHWRSQTQMITFEDTGAAKPPEPMTLPEPPPQLGLPGQSLNLQGTVQLQSRGDQLFFVNREGDEVFEAEVVWKGDRPEKWIRRQTLPKGAMSPRVVRDNFMIYMTAELDEKGDPIRRIWLDKAGEKRLLVKRKAYVSEIFLSRDKLIWLEEFVENNRLCWAPRSILEGKAKAKDIRCKIKAVYPQALTVLGNQSDDAGDVTDLWIGQSEETVYGDRFEVSRWRLGDDSMDRLQLAEGGKPISLGVLPSGIWLALSDRQYHFLRKIDETGRCLEEKELSQIVEKMYSSKSDALTLSFWQSTGTLIVRSSPGLTPSQPCRLHDQPTSPLQMVQRHPDASVQEIIAANDPWTLRSVEAITEDRKLIASAAPLGTAAQIDGQAALSKDAEWHAQPIFAFPWIGVDAKGYQIGTLSVPLMDHLQNETLTLSALYGVESRYPNLELTLGSSRFSTYWSLGVFRRQSWNGVYRNESLYFDERGVEIQALSSIPLLGVGVRAGYKNAYMLPYIGDPAVWNVLAHGYLREFSLGLSKSQPIFSSTLSSYVNSNIATKQFNANYDYEQLGLGLSLNVPISIFGRPTSQNYGVSYSRVRGTRRKFLREAYRPLRTFVPGSGGGLNEINQPVLGPGALTSAKYGDTQARMQFAWTYPIFEDMAKMIHIVYLQRLDFTAFYNYGTAWNHSETKPRFYDAVRAHGYNLDLQADIKGVKVNLGLGTGQVLGYDMEVYFLFGFDALIDQGKN